MNVTMTETSVNKIQSLIVKYELLLQFMRDANDERLAELIEDIDQALTQLKHLLAQGVDAKTRREMLKGVRQGLRETPKLLSSIVPERSAKLMDEFETLIGHRFSDF